MKNYHLVEPIDCVLFSHGLTDIYRIRTPDLTCYLKIYEAGIANCKKVHQEVEALVHLTSRCPWVAHPIACKDDTRSMDFASPEGDRLGVLYTAADGIPLGRCLSPENCNKYGELLARTHDGLDDARMAQGTLERLDIRESADQIASCIDQRQLKRRLDSIRHSIEEVIAVTDAALISDDCPMGICHGDVHDFNVHVAIGGALTLFDFSAMHFGWRAYDLATFLRVMGIRNERSSVGGIHIEFEQGEMFTRWLSFLAGYEGVRGLTVAERSAIYALVPVRRLVEIGWIAMRARVYGSRTCRPDMISKGFDFIENWIKRYPGNPLVTA